MSTNEWTTEEVRMYLGWNDDTTEKFDRWLAGVVADARREALEEAARQWSDDPADDDEKTVHDWLLRRASEIRKGIRKDAHQ